MVRTGSPRADRPDGPAAASSGRPTAPLLAVCAGYFMVILDVTVINVAVPVVGRDLSASLTGDPVDHGRLHPGPRRSAADRRRTGRPAGQPADLLHRGGGVHPRVGRLRTGPEQRDPDRRPAGGRAWRGADRARLPRPPPAGVSLTGRALPGLRPVGLHGGHRRLRRPSPGRPPGHHRRLALGVLHQPARRMRLPVADAAPRARVGPASGPPRGLAGPVSRSSPRWRCSPPS